MPHFVQIHSLVSVRTDRHVQMGCLSPGLINRRPAAETGRGPTCDTLSAVRVNGASGCSVPQRHSNCPADSFPTFPARAGRASRLYNGNDNTATRRMEVNGRSLIESIPTFRWK